MISCYFICYLKLDDTEKPPHMEKHIFERGNKLLICISANTISDVKSCAHNYTFVLSPMLCHNKRDSPQKYELNRNIEIMQTTLEVSFEHNISTIAYYTHQRY